MKYGWKKLVSFFSYEIFYNLLHNISADAITPLLDNKPVNTHKLFSGSLWDKFYSLKSLGSIFRMGEPYYAVCTLTLHK